MRRLKKIAIYISNTLQNKYIIVTYNCMNSDSIVGIDKITSTDKQDITSFKLINVLRTYKAF